MTNASELPHLQVIFDSLRAGHHISSEDGPVWIALREHLDDFRALFEALGFRLEAHARGFFYFQGREEVGKDARALAVFFFILIEWLGDSGHDIEHALFEKPLPVGELPHFRTDRYRRLISEAGIESEEQLAGLLTRLEKLGFARRLGDDAIAFGTPAWRFLDLCAEIARDASEKTPPANGDAGHE